MAKKATREMTCKYCKAQWTLVQVATEDLSLFQSCCRKCWEDDVPGMIRFNRMAEMMGSTWALEHYGPIA